MLSVWARKGGERDCPGWGMSSPVEWVELRKGPYEAKTCARHKCSSLVSRMRRPGMPVFCQRSACGHLGSAGPGQNIRRERLLASGAPRPRLTCLLAARILLSGTPSPRPTTTARRFHRQRLCLCRCEGSVGGCGSAAVLMSHGDSKGPLGGQRQRSHEERGGQGSRLDWTTTLFAPPGTRRN